MIIIKGRFEFSFSTGYSFPDYVTKSEYDKKNINSFHRAPERKVVGEVCLLKTRKGGRKPA